MREVMPSIEIPESEASGLLTIDLTALVANWLEIKRYVENAECAAVVKANAFGLGVEPVVSALSQKGCATFFAAFISEGKRIRKINPNATIYLLNGFIPEAADAFISYGLRPVLGSITEIEEWVSLCGSRNTKLPAALHVDTGMNRLGLTLGEALSPKTLALTSAFDLTLLMSHLVIAEEHGNPINQKQIDAFERARKAFPQTPASLANSLGIYLPQKPHYDMVRTGYALYGGNPAPGKPNPMQTVIRLEGKILNIRQVVKGETCSYSGLWTADAPKTLATIGIGYADGFFRGGSGWDSKREKNIPAGNVLINDQLCPIVGSISMDMCTVDVTHIPQECAQRGKMATFIGGSLTFVDVGKNAGTNGAETLTNLGTRYARRYIDFSY